MEDLGHPGGPPLTPRLTLNIEWRLRRDRRPPSKMPRSRFNAPPFYIAFYSVPPTFSISFLMASPNSGSWAGETVIPFFVGLYSPSLAL